MNFGSDCENFVWEMMALFRILLLKVYAKLMMLYPEHFSYANTEGRKMEVRMNASSMHCESRCGSLFSYPWVDNAWIRCFVIVCATIIMSLPFVPSSAANEIPAAVDRLVWFAPESHYPPAEDSDFLKIFSQPKAWHYTLTHIQVLQLSTQFFVFAPDKIVAEVVRFVEAQGLHLALAAEASCGRVPGTPELAQRAATKIERVGGKIDYITLDEPMWYIHYSPRQSDCHLPLPDTVKRVAAIIHVYTDAFPHVKIGDVEPFPALSGEAGWRDTYLAWLRDFQRATGQRITFLHLDFNWREPRLTRGNVNIPDPPAIFALSQSVVSFAQANHLPVGMIFDGKANARSDKEWVEQALANISLIGQSGIKLDQIIFQSWYKYPVKVLPEADGTTFSGLIRRYLELQ